MQLQNAWRRYSSISYSEVTSIQSAALGQIFGAMFSDVDPRQNARIESGVAYSRVRDFMRRQDTRLRQSRQSFTELYEADPKIQAAVARIDEIERKIEIAERPRRKLQELVERFVTGPKDIVFTPGEILVFGANGGSIELARLSSGEKHLLRMLVAGVDAERTVMLIDEPELSLHIDWQRELLGALETLTVETQVIVATHSPEIMATIADDQITMI